MTSTKRHCLVLDLRDDPELIAEYERYHVPGTPPAAVSQAIRRDGIVAMEIWRAGPRLFMIIEVDPTYDPAAKRISDADDPAVQAWEVLMWRFQQALPWARPGEKWLEAARIFDLAEQP